MNGFFSHRASQPLRSHPLPPAAALGNAPFAKSTSTPVKNAPLSSRCNPADDPDPKPAAPSQRIRLKLALQGGGAHGAFTWGVVERLAEHPDIDFHGVSGASAGAITGGLIVSALAGRGDGSYWNGRGDAVSKALTDFWFTVSAMDPIGLFSFREAALKSPLGSWLFAMSKIVKSYDGPALSYNPLGRKLQEHLDIQAIRQMAGSLPLLISATNAVTGDGRVFAGDDLSVDAFLASICLPQLFPAVLIDGVPYWDGGYALNPPVINLVEASDQDCDVLLIQLNPSHKPFLATTEHDVKMRMTELSFSTALAMELSCLNRLQESEIRLHQDDRFYSRARLHRILIDEADLGLDTSTMSDTTWSFLTRLHAAGRIAADRWIDEVGHLLGRISSYAPTAY